MEEKFNDGFQKWCKEKRCSSRLLCRFCGLVLAGKGQLHTLFILVMINVCGVIVFTRLILPSKFVLLRQIKMCSFLRGNYLLCTIIQRTGIQYFLSSLFWRYRFSYWALLPTHMCFLPFILPFLSPFLSFFLSLFFVNLFLFVFSLYFLLSLRVNRRQSAV